MLLLFYKLLNEMPLLDFNSSIQLYNNQLDQLDERINFEQALTTCDTNDMPNVIKSEQGVAFKKGTFYEIIEEVKDEPPPTKGKRISRVKR